MFQVLAFVFIGIALLWFGFALFFNGVIPVWDAGGRTGKRRNSATKAGKAEGAPGDPQICPVCSLKLKSGEMVSSAAFPSLNGGKDRFMHIRGCIYCLAGERDRVCPVCGTILVGDEILICRLFERPGRRSHVHVLGCSRCKKHK
jgi:hypothetical protein